MEKDSEVAFLEPLPANNGVKENGSKSRPKAFPKATIASSSQSSLSFKRPLVGGEDAQQQKRAKLDPTGKIPTPQPKPPQQKKVSDGFDLLIMGGQSRNQAASALFNLKAAKKAEVNTQKEKKEREIQIERDRIMQGARMQREKEAAAQKKQQQQQQQPQPQPKTVTPSKKAPPTSASEPQAASILASPPSASKEKPKGFELTLYQFFLGVREISVKSFTVFNNCSQFRVNFSLQEGGKQLHPIFSFRHIDRVVQRPHQSFPSVLIRLKGNAPTEGTDISDFFNPSDPTSSSSRIFFVFNENDQYQRFCDILNSKVRASSLDHNATPDDRAAFRIVCGDDIPEDEPVAPTKPKAMAKTTVDLTTPRKSIRQEGKTALSKSVLLERNPRDLFTFPFDGKDAITVSTDDSYRLNDGKWFNDTVIDFYLRYVFENLKEPLKSKVHIFNTFFYRRMCLKISGIRDPKERAQKMHENVRRWTSKKGINLFDKDFIFVPVNENLHWYLVVICYPGSVVRKKYPEDAATQKPESTATEESSESDEEGSLSELDDEDGGSDPDLEKRDPESESTMPRNRPLISVFDSLGGFKRAVISALSDYLCLEYQAIYKREITKSDLGMTESATKVPRQNNGYDCGVFVTHFVEKFLEDCQKDDFLARMSKKNLDCWFNGEDITQKRSDMRELFRKLEGSYALKHAATKSAAAPHESSDEDAVIIEPKKPAVQKPKKLAEQREEREKIQPKAPQKKKTLPSPTVAPTARRTPSLIDLDGLVKDSNMKESLHQRPKPIPPQKAKGLFHNVGRLPNTC